MNARQGATSFQGPRARLGESPRAVWDAVSKLNGGVVEPLNGYRMTYPPCAWWGATTFALGRMAGCRWSTSHAPAWPPATPPMHRSTNFTGT